MLVVLCFQNVPLLQEDHEDQNVPLVQEDHEDQNVPLVQEDHEDQNVPLVQEDHEDQNVPLVQEDHETMVVPPRKRSKTIVYSGKKRPECTKGTSLYQPQCVQPHVH